MPWYSHTHTTEPLAAAIEPPTVAGRLERAWALLALSWSELTPISEIPQS